ncbi:hypothetical protein H5410_023458, partial [Solanum commersonii]
NINLLEETLGCNIDYLTTIYFGLPLGAKANFISIWDEILQKKKGVKRNHGIGKGKIFLLDGKLVAVPKGLKKTGELSYDNATRKKVLPTWPSGSATMDKKLGVRCSRFKKPQ